MGKTLKPSDSRLAALRWTYRNAQLRFDGRSAHLKTSNVISSVCERKFKVFSNVP